MKKRFFSALLAVLMLLSAVPAVLPQVVRAAETEFPSTEYDALYVKAGLIYALDFYSLNEYWGGTATLPVPPADTFQGEMVSEGKFTTEYSTAVNAYKKELSNLFAGFVTYTASTITTVQQTPSAGAQSYQDATGDSQRASFTLGKGYITLTQPHSGCFVYVSNFPQDGIITEEAVIAAGTAARTHQFITLRDVAIRLDATSESFSFFGIGPYSNNSAYDLSPAFALKATVNTPLTLTVTDERVKGTDAVTHTASMWVNGTAAFEDVETTDTSVNTANTMFGYQNNGMASKVYAFRFYNRALTDAERAQNHFADLAKWFRLDLTQYNLMSAADRAELHTRLAGFDFTSDRAALVSEYAAFAELAIYGVLYDGITPGTPEYAATDAFVGRAAAAGLTLSVLSQLPVADRLAVFALVAEYKGSDPAELQRVFDAATETVINDRYGQYIDKNEYDYRDLYVKQDYLETAIDFFGATPEDGNVYVGVSYDSWVDNYNDVKANWSSTSNVFGRTFSSQAEAIQYARDNRADTPRPNEWDTLLGKYLWKGDAENLQPLDISDRNYPHTNVRTYGDGRLICTLNNSLIVKHANDDSDVTYQVISKVTGAPNWQLRGFRVGMSGAATFAFTSMTYSSFGVNASGVTNNSTLYTENIAYADRLYVDSAYSTDMTVVADKAAGADGGHYYRYVLNESTGKYEITEVEREKDGNSSLITYYGRFDLSLYANGRYAGGMTDRPYNLGSPDSIGNSGANEFFAVRVYSCTLSESDILQNHFADLAGYYGFNLSNYYRLSAEDRLTVHTLLRDLQLGTPREEAAAAYRDAVGSLYYELDGEGEAYESFRTLAKAYSLDVTSLRGISPLTRQRLYDLLAADERYAPDSTWFPALLQCHLEGYISALREEYYAESMVHLLTEHIGYQLKKSGGDPGMRALFSLRKDDIAALLEAYEAIDLTLGMMLLPAGDTSAVTVENGKVVLPETAIASVTAYENGAYTDACFERDGAPVYALEYFPQDVKAKVSYVGYAVITLPGEESIIFHIDPAKGDINPTFSLYDLTRHAKRNLGLAYENIQKVMNAESGKEDVVLSVGPWNIGEYVIYGDGGNGAAVEALQDLLEENVGIRLRVVSEDAIAGYDRVIYLGDYDLVVEDEDLYGLALRGKSLHIWATSDDNIGLSLEILEEYLAYAANGDGSARIQTGTDIIRRDRAN